MNKGILYGVGVGPGDSELLTLKAVRIIKENRVLAVPRTGEVRSLALNIVSDAVDITDKKVIYLDFPMVKDKNKTAENYMINALKIQEFLKNGENVVFISLGDISVYSTFGCLQPIVAENGYKTVMIPGVPSFCAVSSALGISLTEKNKPIHIIPAVYGGIESYMELAGTKVFMKSSGKLEEIKKESKNRGLLDKSFAVADCGLETEKIIRQFDTAEDNTGYFTTVIVKE